MVSLSFTVSLSAVVPAHLCHCVFVGSVIYNC